VPLQFSPHLVLSYAATRPLGCHLWCRRQILVTLLVLNRHLLTCPYQSTCCLVAGHVTSLRLDQCTPTFHQCSASHMVLPSSRRQPCYAHQRPLHCAAAACGEPKTLTLILPKPSLTCCGLWLLYYLYCFIVWTDCHFLLKNNTFNWPQGRGHS